MANVFIEASTMTAIGDAIRSKTGGMAQIYPEDMPAQIASITTGGGDSELVRYVTFLDEDGSELFKMPVLVGDDCKDPVTHGDISKPEKEDTNTIDYTYSGWTSTVGSTADSDILKNITEDKTVYVAYAVSTRYYTVRFYANDALFDTVQVTYNGTATPSGTPTKDGYSFSSWDPSPTNVTADMDCYAVWTEGIKFATATWAKIAEISEAGNAAQVFSVGDEKTISWGGTNVTVFIAGFAHDDLADGSGKAGISIMFKDIPEACKGKWRESSSVERAPYASSALRTYMNGTFANNMPTDLKAVVKDIVKPCDKDWTTGSMVVENVSGKFFPVSLKEVGVANPATATTNDLGEEYAYYNTVTNTCGTSTPVDYTTRNLKHVSSSSKLNFYQITTTGKAKASDMQYNAYPIKAVFCV